MKRQTILLFIALLFPSRVSFAQYYDTGQDPASLKWMQIKTSRFTVIYPEKYDSGGVAYVRALDEAYSKLLTLFPERKFTIPVIIHNYTTNSNGYVAWAPKRMEIYPTPEQNTIPLAPEKQLALHELTHVLQMESLNRGFSKVMSVIMGEQFTGITASLLPLWFFEGDAVFAETALTESGRGRSPFFQKDLKALAVEKGKLYNYDKTFNGSFRDYIPDHYQTGYQIVTWAMTKGDPKIWNKVLDFTAKEPFTINPFNISLRKNAGLTKKKLYIQTFDSLQAIWKKDVAENNAISYKILNPAKNGKYMNYYSPVYAGPDSIIAIKTSLSSPAEFVLINPSLQSERKILTPGQLFPWYLSYSNHMLVWVETQPDPRWENREYSVIKTMNIRNNTVRKLTRKSRYLSASISPDGNMIAAFENTVNNTNSLVIIDTKTGKVLQSEHSPGNIYLQRPQWSADGTKIIVISLSDAGEGIISYTVADHKWEVLIDAGREDLQSTFIRNDSLFFISSISGTDNIYLRTSGNNIKVLTRSAFGTADLCLYGKTILFTDYSSLGSNLCMTTLEETSGAPLKRTGTSPFIIDRINIEKKSSDIKETKTYTPEPYKKWQHLFNFHSWMPFYADLDVIKSDPTTVRPGVALLTQNQLSTLISTVGYEYSAEQKHLFHANVSWKGWYPVIESQLTYGYSPKIYKSRENVSNPSGISPGISFANTVSVPLQFNSGMFSEYLRPSLSSDYRNEYIYLKDELAYDYGQTIVTGRVYFTNYSRSALRDIYPTWAQTFDLSYSYAPFDKNIYGTAFAVKTSFFFPGVFINHSIKIRAEKEILAPVKYFFSGNRVSLPRGYNNLFSKNLWFFSGDYNLPLVYPDFNVAGLFYLKRVRTDFFYDYATGPGSSFYDNTINGLVPVYTTTDTESFKSFGFELLSDFHLFRIPYMISGGVQTTWKSFTSRPSFGLLFNIDLFGMSIGKQPM